MEIASAAPVPAAGSKLPDTAERARDIASATIEINPAVPDFGMVPAGSRRERAISVTNRGNREITIASFRVSCDCLTVTISRSAVLPGETVPGRVAIDLSTEPEWHGKLSLEVDALDSDEHSLITFRVPAEVQPGAGSLEDL